jgi:sarcosine oxidase
LRRLEIPVERIGPDDLVARWPQLAADDLAFAIHEPEAGVLMARRGVAAAARTFTSEGGRFELAQVRPGRVDGRRLLDVVTGNGSRHAAASFVFACGPWLPRLFPTILGDMIRVTKQDVCFFGPPGGDDRFGAERLPAWVDHDASFYGIGAVDGGGMKAAADRYGPVFDPSNGERIVDADTVRLTRAYVARRFPGLAESPVVETRVCQYEMTADAEFVIDRHPGLDNVWLVGGGSGHGFKHGPVIGRYVVEQLDRGPAEARFAIDRPRLPGPTLRTGGDTIAATWDTY